MTKFYYSTFSLFGFLISIGQVSFTPDTILIKDMAFQSGVAVGVSDLNGDLLDDIFRLDQGKTPHIFLQHAQYEPFIEKIVPTGVSQAYWSVAIADINNDFINDIALATLTAPNVDLMLAKNNLAEYDLSQLRTDSLQGQGLNMVDINSDGQLDLFVCNDVGQSYIWLNDNESLVENSGFINTSISSDRDSSGNYAANWVDFDNDQDLDLYINRCRLGLTDPMDPVRINSLYVNDGNNNFSEDIDNEYGIRLGWQTWLSDFGDIDNDGDLDLLSIHHDHDAQIFENDGTGHFTEITDITGIRIRGLTEQGIFKDFNNDGFVDILAGGVTEYFYKNNGDKTFTRIDISINNENDISSFAIGDLNSDGFLDIYATYNKNINIPSSINDILWLNDGNDNNFVSLHLIGETSNRNAVGSRIEAHGEWGVQLRDVRAGEGYGISNSHDVIFGLGQANSVDSLVVWWPDGERQVFQQFPINEKLTLHQGRCLSTLADISVQGMLNICAGESTTLTAPSGYSYNWINGQTSQSISVSEAGSYTVRLLDSEGCMSYSESVTIQVNVDETPTIASESIRNICKGDIITLTSSAASDYTWSTNESGQSLEVGLSGDYTVTIPGQCQDWTSDPVTVNVYTTEIPNISDVVIMEPKQVTLEVDPAEEVRWYEGVNDQNPISIGHEFTTPLVNEDVSYYVEQDLDHTGERYFGGKPQAIGTGGENPPVISGGLKFDVYEKMILRAVDVRAFGQGDRTFQVIDSQNEKIFESTKTLDDGLQRVELNIELNPGTDYLLQCAEDPSLYRNLNEAEIDFPYPLGDIGVITESVFGTALYLFFYNWEVSRPSTICTSERAEVLIDLRGVSTNEISNNALKLEVFPNPSNEDLNISVESIDHSVAQIIITSGLGQVLNARSLELIGGVTSFNFKTDDWGKGVYNIMIESNGRRLVEKWVKL